MPRIVPGTEEGGGMTQAEIRALIEKCAEEPYVESDEEQWDRFTSDRFADVLARSREAPLRLVLWSTESSFRLRRAQMALAKDAHRAWGQRIVDTAKLAADALRRAREEGRDGSGQTDPQS